MGALSNIGNAYKQKHVKESICTNFHASHVHAGDFSGTVFRISPQHQGWQLGGRAKSFNSLVQISGRVRGWDPNLRRL